MTDPHVTKLSSVPRDGPNIQHRYNKKVGKVCRETAQFKIPIPTKKDPEQNDAANASEGDLYYFTLRQ